MSLCTSDTRCDGGCTHPDDEAWEDWEAEMEPWDEEMEEWEDVPEAPEAPEAPETDDIVRAESRPGNRVR